MKWHYLYSNIKQNMNKGKTQKDTQQMNRYKKRSLKINILPNINIHSFIRFQSPY